ncbi:hypothetical protein Bca101_072438 [Brassica carinata]
MKDQQFAWILWYIWKAMNTKVFNNLDIDPLDTLKLAETESTLWAETQILKEQRTRQAWYNTLEGFDGLLGGMNVRDSLSPLHAEMEALLWAMVCMRNLRQFHVTFATDCSQLVKMVSEPEEWPAFANYLEDVKNLKESFTRSEIIYVPRTQNTKADRIAHSVRKQPSFVVHMDTDHPVWFTESV